MGYTKHENNYIPFKLNFTSKYFEKLSDKQFSKIIWRFNKSYNHKKWRMGKNLSISKYDANGKFIRIFEFARKDESTRELLRLGKNTRGMHI